MMATERHVRLRSLTVSPSQKATWDLCPRKWWLRYGEGLKAPPSGILHAGSAVHLAMESYFQDIKSGSGPNLDFLIQVFLEKFDSGSDFNWKGFDREAMVSGLIAALSKFHRHLGQRIKPEEIEHRFSIQLDGTIKLVGILDLLGEYCGELSEPAGRIICEWKTTHILPPDLKPNHRFQIRTYQVFSPEQALVVYLGWKEKAIKVFVVDPPTQEDRESILRQYQRFIQARQEAILSASFDPAPAGHKLCSKKWCDFWHECHSYPWDKLKPEYAVEKLLDSHLLEELD